MTQVLNDVHSKLNPTRVRRVERLATVEDARTALLGARASGTKVIAAGGMHAMGGQQLVTDGIVLDTRGLDRILGFDREKGLVKVGAGIQWPALVDALTALQDGSERAWGIRQKQTGADRFTIGGSLSSNVHGRGLRMAPMVSDVEALELLRPDGRVVEVSRTVEPELFRLVAGGYGLFGVIVSVTLRLAARRKLERVVEVREAAELPGLFAARIEGGFLYGDFQFSCDGAGDDFLRKGVFSCYRPVADATPMPEGQQQLGAADWQKLIHLAHVAKGEAFRQYARYYLGTSGQLYWSDLHQLSFYLDDYHPELDKRCCAKVPGSEMIGELYVPRDALPAFLEDAREDFRRHDVDVIYGTVRLIEKDTESFLPWAREPYACVVFNLHTDHTPKGIDATRRAFVRLIDLAIRRQGSYYLTYHGWARRDQVEACYPGMARFLELKAGHDPGELLVSDWYLGMKRLFGRD